MCGFWSNKDVINAWFWGRECFPLASSHNWVYFKLCYFNLQNDTRPQPLFRWSSYFYVSPLAPPTRHEMRYEVLREVPVIDINWSQAQGCVTRPVVVQDGGEDGQVGSFCSSFYLLPFKICAVFIRGSSRTFRLEKELCREDQTSVFRLFFAQ